VRTLCIYVCMYVYFQHWRSLLIFPSGFPINTIISLLSTCTYAHICIYLYQFTNIHIYVISFLLVPMTILFFFHLILYVEPGMQHHTYVNISRDTCINIYIYTLLIRMSKLFVVASYSDVSSGARPRLFLFSHCFDLRVGHKLGRQRSGTVPWVLRDWRLPFLMYLLWVSIKNLGAGRGSTNESALCG